MVLNSFVRFYAGAGWLTVLQCLANIAGDFGDGNMSLLRLLITLVQLLPWHVFKALKYVGYVLC